MAHISPNTSSATSTSSRYTTNSQQPTPRSQESTANSQQAQQPRRGPGGNRSRDLLDVGWSWWFWWSWCLCLGWCAVGVFWRSKKTRPIDIISFSLGHTSKSTLQTSHPSPSCASLDTPARPADSLGPTWISIPCTRAARKTLQGQAGWMSSLLVSCC